MLRKSTLISLLHVYSCNRRVFRLLGMRASYLLIKGIQLSVDIFLINFLLLFPIQINEKLLFLYSMIVKISILLTL